MNEAEKREIEAHKRTLELLNIRLANVERWLQFKKTQRRLERQLQALERQIRASEREYI